MNASIWNKRTSQAYAGTVINVAASILSVIVGFFVGLSAVGSALTGDDTGFGFSVVLLALVGLLALAGAIVFFFGIMGLKDAAVGETDAPAFNKIFIAAILSICGSLVSILPIPILSTIIAGCLELAAVILYLIAYSNLKSSATLAAFSPNAVNGFGKLFVAEILYLVAIVICLIPLIGAIIGGILEIVAFVFTFIGWKKVATPVVEAGAEAQAPKSIVNLVKDSFVDSFEDTKAVFKK